MNNEQKLPIQELIPSQLDTLFSKEHLLVMRETHTTLRKLSEIIGATFFPEGLDEVSRSLRQAAKNSGMHDTQWVQNALEELKFQKRMGVTDAESAYRPFGDVAIDALRSITLNPTKRTEMIIVTRLVDRVDMPTKKLSEVWGVLDDKAKSFSFSAEKWFVPVRVRLQERIAA